MVKGRIVGTLAFPAPPSALARFLRPLPQLVVHQADSAADAATNADQEAAADAQRAAEDRVRPVVLADHAAHKEDVVQLTQSPITL